MNPIKSFFSRRKPAALLTKDELVGWHTTGVSTLDYYKNNQYENGYGSISKIVNAFMDIKPYTVNENAERVDSNLQDRLYHPNQDMSSSDFREALAVMSLIHDRVFILCWRNEAGEAKPGGVITEQNLAGFTFLENPVVTLIDNKKIYTYNGNTYTESEVIELKDINPYNLHKGFSPAKAASKWATIDDYIAAYQTGFFKNGAVPTGQFIITAATPQEFNDEVDKLEAKHKGAGKNNNIIYVHRPTDREGKPSNAKIEWVPFNVQNKDLSLNDLFEQANKKIDGVYGVPAEIRGILSNSNYASVNVAEKIFIKYVVKPFTQKVYTRFTHQLKRITGGLSVGISFELDVPGLVDEELVVEQTKKHRDERVQFYLDRNYTLASIQSYLDTDDLTMLESNSPAVEEDNADIDDDNEVKEAPDVPDGSGDGSLLNKLQVKKKIIKAVSPNPDVDKELEPFEERIQELLKAQIDRQADRMATTVQDVVQDATQQENDDLTEEIAAILLALMIQRGSASAEEAIEVARSQGLDVPEDFEYVPTSADVDETQILQYVEGFNQDTSDELAATVAAALAAGIAADQIRQMLAGFSDNQGYRLNRFAQNESWIFAQKAKLGAVEALSNELKKNQTVIAYKTWVIQPGACPLCTPYSGERVEIGVPFSNGLQIPPLHVACRCTIQESFEKVEIENVVEKELHCSACDRFLGMTDKQEYTDKLKCPISKCGVLDIPVIKEEQCKI